MCVSVSNATSRPRRHDLAPICHVGFADDVESFAAFLDGFGTFVVPLPTVSAPSSLICPSSLVLH